MLAKTNHATAGTGSYAQYGANWSCFARGRDFVKKSAT